MLTGLFDTYGRNAWLRTALIVSLPITALVVVIFTITPPWWADMSSLIGASGVIYLAADIVQYLGKSKEPMLWDGWGGAPSTLLLRYKDNANSAQVDRYHTLLRKILPDMVIPTFDEEREDPVGADQHYITATKALIARTNNHAEFPMVFMQNYRYGFRRNLWGSRTLGVTACIVSLVIVLTCVGLNIWLGTKISWAGLCFVGLLDLLLLGSYIKIVTRNWVRQTADAYASRLLESLEKLKS